MSSKLQSVHRKITLASSIFLWASLGLGPVRAEKPSTSPPALTERGLKVCVASDAPDEIRKAAERILAAVPTQPLLAAMSGERKPVSVTDSKTLIAAPPVERAFHHLVLVGLPSDPMIAATWQREARLRTDGELYVFGFGLLRGDVGYIESDRNPFLHSRLIATAPFETEVVTITGDTPLGVVLAAESFLKQGLVFGCVAKAGWRRPEPNLLEHDPLSPGFSPPDWLPQRAGEWIRIGLIQAGEDEYRGVLADTGLEPREIWRAKFYRPGVWDGAGAKSAFGNYTAGLHRRAYGNSLWLAHFASEAEASAAAPKIAEAARLKRGGSAEWKGIQPPYSSEKEPAGPLELWQRGEWVVMSTLPEGMTR